MEIGVAFGIAPAQISDERLARQVVWQ